MDVETDAKKAVYVMMEHRESNRKKLAYDIGLLKRGTG